MEANLSTHEMATKTLSKIERYKWKVVDVPGVFREIHKSQLSLDQSYQR